jgi:hypothetical protein
MTAGVRVPAAQARPGCDHGNDPTGELAGGQQLARMSVLAKRGTKRTAGSLPDPSRAHYGVDMRVNHGRGAYHWG